MADLTITSKQIRNDLLHPCFVVSYEITAANTIAAGDVVTIVANKAVKAVAQTTALGIAITGGTAGEFIEVIRHGGASREAVQYNSLDVTPAVFETLILNGLFVS